MEAERKRETGEGREGRAEEGPVLQIHKIRGMLCEYSSLRTGGLSPFSKSNSRGCLHKMAQCRHQHSTSLTKNRNKC
jgi:hypothetical protein